MKTNAFTSRAAHLHRATAVCILFFAALLANAQTNMAGRIYKHDNILADELNEQLKDVDKKIKDARAEAIAKAEKKKGRKLNEKELKELDKHLEEAVQMAQAMKTGMKTAVIVEFKDEKNLVMQADMKISEDALKAAGVGWLKRKAIKAALAIAPKSQKGTYVVQGNRIIVDDGEEKDTMTLSNDGRFLSGKLDEKQKFKLTRVK